MRVATGSGPRDFTASAQHIDTPGAALRSPHMRCLGREGERQEGRQVLISVQILSPEGTA